MADIKKRGELDLSVKGGKASAQDVNSVKGAFDGLKVAIAGTAVAYGVMKVASTALDWAEDAARLNDVTRAYKNLADSAGVDSVEMLKQMRAATGNAISDLELMQKSSTAVMLGLPLDRFDDMLSIARSAAVATGQDLKWMMDSIVIGLGRQSKLVLDNVGILVDVEAAQTKYATSIGKTASQLTEAERKQVFINSALDVGIDNISKMGGLIGSETDPFVRLHTEIGELKTALGQEFLTVLSDAVSGIDVLLESWTETLGDKGIAGLLAELPMEKISVIAGMIAGAQVGKVFGPGGALIGGAIGAAGGWAGGPSVQSGLAASGRETEAERLTIEFEAEYQSMITRSKKAYLEMAQMRSKGVPIGDMKYALGQLSDFNKYLGEIKSWGEMSFGGALLRQAEEAVQSLADRVQMSETMITEAPFEPMIDHLTYARNLHIEFSEAVLDSVGEIYDGYGQISDGVTWWADATEAALNRVVFANQQIISSLSSLILAHRISASSIGNAVQAGVRAQLAGIAAMAVIDAARYTYLGIAAMAQGLTAWEASGFFAAAGQAAATAVAAGVGASIGPSAGGYSGGYSGGSMDTGLEGMDGSSGGSRNINVTRTAPTHINISHSYYGTVNYGSQAESDAASVQETLDSGELYLPGEVA